MKKFVFFISIFFISFVSTVSADECLICIDENYSNLSIKSRFDIGDSTILVLEDNSLWEMFSFEIRSRTIGEWWNGYEIKVDSELLWERDDWTVYDKVFVDNNNSDVSIADNFKDIDKKKYRSYRYIINNMDTGKVAFVKPLEIADLAILFNQLAENQYHVGYDSGYSLGYINGNSDGYDNGFNDAYNGGYETGYSEGYQCGHGIGYNEATQDCNASQ